MTGMLDQLHQDHINMAELLELIERELRLLDGDEPADLALVYDALHYLTHYGDLYHHPVEDRLFAHLQRSDASIAAEVDRLQNEHRALFQKGKAFADVVQEIESEVAMERSEFKRLARDYLRAQRQHLDFEEQVMFPLARERMEAGVLDELEADLGVDTDPLFGRLVRQEYERLKSAL
ncbi:MAG: hemerythrin domain-containing protein [Gammaproteobacteria bacterium]|nr:hemerythrin domain-containing protein [Gammaproteobacteria bacterium]